MTTSWQICITPHVKKTSGDTGLSWMVSATGQTTWNAKGANIDVDKKDTVFFLIQKNPGFIWGNKDGFNPTPADVLPVVTLEATAAKIKVSKSSDNKSTVTPFDMNSSYVDMTNSTSANTFRYPAETLEIGNAQTAANAPFIFTISVEICGLTFEVDPKMIVKS